MSFLRPGYWAVLGAILSVLLLHGCVPEGGTSTGTESNLRLQGSLVLVDGDPAQGATIRLFRIDSLGDIKAPGRTVDTTLSDSAGHYSFTGLAPGIFSVQAEFVASLMDTLRADRPSIRLDRSLHIGVDTLRTPGFVVGRVLAEGTPLEGAFCFIPGSSHVATTDSSGRCLLSQVAPGRYEVAFWADGRLMLKVSPVVVLPGKGSHLDPVSLSRNPGSLPPPPDGLQCDYDRRAGVVALRWNRRDGAGIRGYLLFRADQGEARMKLLAESVLQDTVYRDTVYRGISKPDSAVFFYNLKSLDSNSNESPFGIPVPVTVVAPPGIANPFPGTRSQAMDTALRFSWSVASARNTAATESVLLMDTVQPPRETLGVAGAGGGLDVAGLRPGQTYYWSILCRVDSIPVQGPVWSFRTREVSDGEDTSAIAYVDIRGAGGHFRVRTRGGACQGCGEKPIFSGPLSVDFGPGQKAVVQVYRNSQPIPVFPAGDPNRLYLRGAPIFLDPGDRNYELKVWKPGESAPAMSIWFSVAKE